MADANVLGYSTLIDIINNYGSADARAQYIQPARILDRKCPLIRMLPMVASNNVLSNIATRTDSLPVPGTRRWNEGVLQTASHNTPINDPIALFEDYSEVDKELCRIQNNPTAWRTDQDMNHIEGFRQTLENMSWYGNIGTNPGAFNGLATRFNNLESFPNGDTSWNPNVLNGGSTSGSVTSMWLIEFGPGKVHGIYPPNTPGGFNIEDLGEVTKENAQSLGSVSQNYLHQVYRTHFTWFMGLQVPDERCVQRIANINPAILSSNDFDENILIEAINYLPDEGSNPGTAIFVNRALKTQIDIRAVSQKINAYTMFKPGMDVFGGRVTTFQGIPIYVAEKLLNTETVIS
jgi:hypothetical protein